VSKFSFKMDGLDELNKDLEKLANAFVSDEVEKSSLDAAEIIRAEAERNAPKGPTGNLKRSLIKKLLKRRAGQPAPAIAAVDRKIAPHAHWIEFGTGPRYQKKTGKYVGSVPARPFFRPALMTKGKSVANRLHGDLKKMVDKAVK